MVRLMDPSEGVTGREWECWAPAGRARHRDHMLEAWGSLAPGSRRSSLRAHPTPPGPQMAFPVAVLDAGLPLEGSVMSSSGLELTACQLLAHRSLHISRVNELDSPISRVNGLS